jgi:NADH-quinone oxidoreductase subunit H
MDHLLASVHSRNGCVGIWLLLAAGVESGQDHVAVVLPVMACVAYLTLWERKVIGWMHVRPWP